MMSDLAALQPQELAEIAGARAEFYTFVDLHFTTLPDAAFVDKIQAPDFTIALETIGADEELAGEIRAGASQMKSYLESVQGEDRSRISETLGVDRTRLYRGVAQGFGPPPPYEAVWSQGGEGHGVLQKVAVIYREAALEISPEAHERLDYIGIELDFLRELAQREAAAWRHNDSEAAKDLLRLQHSFLSAHLGQWAPHFIQKALEFAETDFYKGHLRMLGGFLAAQQQELDMLLEEVDS